MKRNIPAFIIIGVISLAFTGTVNAGEEGPALSYLAQDPEREMAESVSVLIGWAQGELEEHQDEGLFKDRARDEQLIQDMIAAAREISRRPHTYWTDQLNNVDSIAGYQSLAEEIWSQTEGEIDAFVHTVGTAASSRGVATVLKRLDPKVKVVVVEPAESAVLSGGQPGPHKIEGVGIGYTPPLWEPSLVDEIVAVSTDDAKSMARRLAREEGLFAGTSSGANVVAALRVGERLGPEARIVTLMADSGLKYMSTDVYK